MRVPGKPLPLVSLEPYRRRPRRNQPATAAAGMAAIRAVRSIHPGRLRVALLVATVTLSSVLRGGRQSILGTVMDRLVPVAAVTTALSSPMRTALLAGLEEKPEPVIVAASPSIKTSGVTAVMMTGFGAVVRTVTAKVPAIPSTLAVTTAEPGATARKVALFPSASPSTMPRSLVQVTILPATGLPDASRTFAVTVTRIAHVERHARRIY